MKWILLPLIIQFQSFPKHLMLNKLTLNTIKCHSCGLHACILLINEFNYCKMNCIIALMSFIHVNKIIFSNHRGRIQWIKAQWAQSPAGRPLHSPPMEPIVVKATLFFIQITAARCPSDCTRAKQTPARYLCRTANRLAMVVAVAPTGALMTKQPDQRCLTGNRRAVTWVGEAATLADDTTLYQTSELQPILLFSVGSHPAWPLTGRFVTIGLIVLHQASRYWQREALCGCEELRHRLDDLLWFAAEFSQIMNNGKRSGLIFNGFIHHLAAVASTGISAWSFILQRSEYVLELLLRLLLFWI